MLFSQTCRQLYQQEVQASTHFPAKEPVCMINVSLERQRTYIARKARELALQVRSVSELSEEQN